jgi:hypothetical protein
MRRLSVLGFLIVSGDGRGISGYPRAVPWLQYLPIEDVGETWKNQGTHFSFTSR